MFHFELTNKYNVDNLYSLKCISNNNYECLCELHLSKVTRRTQGYPEKYDT